MRKTVWLRAALILLTGALMGTIFLFSSQTSGASNELSRGLAEILLGRIGIHLTAEQIEVCNLVLRKIAHFSLYFLLGADVMGVCLTVPWKMRWRFLLAVLICALFAASDELHQYLSGARNGNVLDVLLDSCGALCGVTAAAWIGKKLKSREERVQRERLR